MGCQVSSDGSHFEQSDYDRLWKRMNSVSEPVKRPANKQTSGWRILRIILVTTYKDFRNERRAVLELIETKLQPIANEKKIYLQLEDFSSGSKAHLDEAANLYLVERVCRDASSSSDYFYLHFLGECSGYILDHTFSDHPFLQKHGISPEQSFPEVFLQLAGLHNSNSLFLYRNPSFLQELPFNVTNFIDTPANRERAKYLTSMIRNEVKPSKFVEYSVRTSGINNTHFKHILFDDLSGAINPIEEKIDQYLIDIDDVDNIDETPSADQFLGKFYSGLKPGKEILNKIESNIRSSKSTLLIGDYSTGKTALLYAILKKHPDSVIIEAKDEMSQVELRKTIERKSKVELLDINDRTKRILLVDNVHLMEKDAQKSLVGNEQLVIIGTSRKKKIDVDMEKFAISSMDSDQITKELNHWIDSENRASNVIRMSQQKRRKSLANLEDGGPLGDENGSWNRLKCRVIGTLGRLGSSDEKCAQLAQLSTLSVVEADMCLMEADGKGHLLIATLCFLTIIESGLNEIELRSLLVSEYTLLPIGIRRTFRNLPFEYSPDEFGTGKYRQIPPLRWYFVVNRIGHLLMTIDPGTNHFVLPTAAKRIVLKKFLKSPNNLEHFKKLLKPVCHRRKEIAKFI